VFACVYTDWVPRHIAAQLPKGHNAASWAAEISDGQVVRLVNGPAEKVAAQLASLP
jgi:hypothetical protein